MQILISLKHHQILRSMIMANYRHILLATDLMKDSARVVHKALEMAKCNEAKLSIVHVVEPLPGYGYAFIVPAEMEGQLLEEAKKQIAQLGEKLSISETDRYIQIGSTRVEITELAKRIKADLIIIGTHSRHGLAILLGSTANGVVQSAPCDVLTVRLKDE